MTPDSKEFLIVATPKNIDALATFLVQQCLIINPSQYFSEHPEVTPIGGYEISQTMFESIKKGLCKSPGSGKLFTTYVRNSKHENFQLYTNVGNAA